jgi:hypothetical protein
VCFIFVCYYLAFVNWSSFPSLNLLFISSFQVSQQKGKIAQKGKKEQRETDGLVKGQVVLSCTKSNFVQM